MCDETEDAFDYSTLPTPSQTEALQADMERMAEVGCFDELGEQCRCEAALARDIAAANMVQERFVSRIRRLAELKYTSECDRLFFTTWLYTWIFRNVGQGHLGHRFN